MTGIEIAVIVGICTIGAFVQGSVGFGMNLIVAPVLALIDTDFVPGPAIVGAGVLTLLITIRDRKGVDRRAVGLATAGRIPATALAATTVAVLPERGLAVVFAVLVLFSVGILASGARLSLTDANVVGAGALSGFMATTTSIGGPPMAMLYAGSSGQHLRGTLSGFFLIGTVISLIGLAIAGAFGVADLGRGLLLVPGVVAGFLLSQRAASFLDAGRTRPAILAVSALASVSVLAKTVL